MLIYQEEANLDVEILIGKIINLVYPDIRNMLARDFFWNQHSPFDSGP